MRASVWPAAAAPPGADLPKTGEGGAGVVQGIVRAAVVAQERRDVEARGSGVEGVGAAEEWRRSVTASIGRTDGALLGR
jgi:hypothetical protein